tara:strand:- start:489 stop:617 length:129 start_codon:yes stop_codon:yes gene_type:complete
MCNRIGFMKIGHAYGILRFPHSFLPAIEIAGYSMKHAYGINA